MADVLFFANEVYNANSFIGSAGEIAAQPLFNFQGSAAFAALAFLGAVLVEGLAVVTTVVLWVRGRRKIALRVAGAGAAAAALYVATLLGFSLASRDEVARNGQEKYFCGLDCHLAYSVPWSREARSLGDGDGRVAARGVFRVVTVAVRFDPDTVCPRRPPDLALTPSPLLVRMVDSSGGVHPVDAAGQRALESAEGRQVSLRRPLKPGESYKTRLVFDVPRSAPDLRLLLTDQSLVTRFLIGHENSLLHKKVFFGIPGEPDGRHPESGYSTRMSAVAVPVFPVVLSRMLTTIR